MMNKMRLHQLSLPMLFVLLLLILPTQQTYAEKRVALVIGNADYKDAPLNNPVHDAIDISEALKKTGFEVDYHSNIDRKQMRAAIRNFGDKLRQADTGLFYFAGHGIQIKGRNYLVPLAVDVHAADEVEDESIDASAVLRKMESAGNAVNIVILDACRNNPFARSFRSLDSGLARMDGPVGSFIAYATAPGSVAADGIGRNGVYTKHLLEALRQPGLTIEQTFKYVRNGVKNATNGQQIPWESSSLMGEFVFLPAQKNISSSVAQIPSLAPPPLPFKYLQVISNVPHAQVIVNNINRGLTGDQGTLNIANLTVNEVEVIVQAKGYAPQRQKIKLTDGQWEQLYVNLKPVSTQQVKSPQDVNNRKAPDSSTRCSVGKRVLLSSKMVFQHDKEKEIKFNVPNIQASIIQSFNESGMDFIDVKQMSDGLRHNGVKKSDFQSLAIKHNLHYLLNVAVDVRELPIKILKTNMKTVNAEITLELLDLKSQRIMASVVRDFNKAGLDPMRVLQKQLKQLLPEISTELLKQACKKTE